MKKLLLLFCLFSTLVITGYEQLKKHIYLTIDDAPSSNTLTKIQYLKEHNIPAIFYCRGNAIEQYKDHVIALIHAGFLIGNHSYSHPYFSESSNEEFFDEIGKTEKLIDECYQLAGCKRPLKVIRLPFGDRGAGGNCRMPVTDEEKNKYDALQQFLKEQGFSRVQFKDLDYDQAIDSLWTLDAQDYKELFVNNEELYKKNLERIFFDSLREVEVVLVHDFENSQHLFESAMTFFKEQKVVFLSFDDALTH